MAAAMMPIIFLAVGQPGTPATWMTGMTSGSFSDGDGDNPENIPATQASAFDEAVLFSKKQVACIVWVFLQDSRLLVDSFTLIISPFRYLH